MCYIYSRNIQVCRVLKNTILKVFWEENFKSLCESRNFNMITIIKTQV